MRATQPLVVELSKVDHDLRELVGGKGANLGEMTKIGLPVPPGFCITTIAYERVASEAGVKPLILELEQTPAELFEPLTCRASQIRGRIEAALIPADIAEAIAVAYQGLGQDVPVAVRSSANAEDLPDASFAGQQDTYLNLVGLPAVLAAVRRCWASLWTDRAVLYRAKNHVDQRAVQLAVVVQRLVPADISGVLFTADPVSGDRTICTVDASYGLGEALVSGRVNADVYRLRKATGALLEARVRDKAVAWWTLPEGGVEARPVPDPQRRARVLSEALLTQLATFADRVEAHFGLPQDIEWCLEQGRLFLVQARPITSLFPLPEPRPHDEALHVYFSIGHAQVNTAALHPMAISLFQRILPPGDYVTQAGGRVYVDLTPVLHSRLLRSVVPALLEEFAPGAAAELRAATDRPEFNDQGTGAPIKLALLPPLLRVFLNAFRQSFRRDLDHVRSDYEAALQAKVTDWQAVFSSAEPGLPKLRVASEQLARMAPGLLPLFLPILYSGIVPWRIIGAITKGRVEPRVVAALARGLPGNVTTAMILELGDLADIARENPLLTQHLQAAQPEAAIEQARALPGSERFISAWGHFLERYGHRCPSENDFALPRWRENPASLVTMVAGMLGVTEAATHRRQFAAAAQEAEAAAQTILQATPPWQRPLLRALIRRVRAYLGLREHHRFAFAQLFLHVRQAILEAAQIAAQRGLLQETDEVWFLELTELIGLLNETITVETARGRIVQRQAARSRFVRLTPPRLMTSDGEILKAAQPATLPAGAFAGLAASAGVVEGIAHVVLDPARDRLQPGEILVAAFTDPGWTPLFLYARALVMEVGGLMTHGTVIAREYGLPAVVGVTGATRLIRTGQRLRVDGDYGLVTLLDQELPA